MQKKSISTIAACAIIAFSPMTFAQQAQPQGAFYDHPTHCANLIGGADYAGDSAGAQFSQAYARELIAHSGPGVSVKQAASRVDAKCIEALGKVGKK